jgi:hypothetical protein
LFGLNPVSKITSEQAIYLPNIIFCANYWSITAWEAHVTGEVALLQIDKAKYKICKFGVPFSP